jgi:cleavage and polyadenylation specificity factor subunit 1
MGGSIDLWNRSVFSFTPRYEFAPNEFVTSLECVTLETLSTETGIKEFIAVGTTIDRGEDLAVKGAVSLI